MLPASLPRPARGTRSTRAALTATAAAAVTLPLLAVATATPAGAAPTSSATTAAARTAQPTTVTVTPSATTLEAGRTLRLKVRVTGAGAGIIRITEGGRTVATEKVREGRALVRLAPAGGPHTYAASFVPKFTDRWLASSAAPVSVTTGVTRSLPLRAGAYGNLVTKAQQRLTWAGVPVRTSGRYDKRTVAAVKRFQSKFFLSQTGVVNERTMAELQRVKLKRLPSECRTVDRAICIDKTRKVAQLVVNGKVTMSLDARFGSVNTPGLATREGVFSIQRKAESHISSEYHTSMPYSMFFSGGQAVHYSQYFAADGYSGASHGCVNIRDFKGIKKMFAKAPIGTRVYVYRS